MDHTQALKTDAGWLGWGHRGFRVDSQGRAALALALLLLLPVGYDVLLSLRTQDAPVYGDLAIYYRAAQAAMEHPDASIYALRHDYLYPPFFLTLLVPLFSLPLPMAVLIFQVCKWTALFFALRLAWRLVSRFGEDVPPIVALGSLLLTARFLINDLGNGNVNTFILLAILGAAWLVQRDWQLAAGFVVAIVACVKVTPALVLVYFVYKGWWRTVLGAGAGTVFCLLLWPGAVMGWAENWRELWAWYDHVIAGFVAGGEVWSGHTNQSICGLINRLLGPAKGMDPDVYLAPVVLSQGTRTVIRGALTLTVLGGLAWVCRRRIDVRQYPLALAAEISLVQIAMLALSGYTWKAHYVAMLLPNAVLLAYLADARYPDGPRRLLKWLLGIEIALYVLTTEVVTPRGADLLEALGGVFLISAVAALAMVVIRRPVVQGAGAEHAVAAGKRGASMAAPNARSRAAVDR